LDIKGNAQGHAIAISLTQGAGVREAKGVLSVDGVTYSPGFLQVERGDWASITGVGEHVIQLTLDRDDPSNRKRPTIVVRIDGQEAFRSLNPVLTTTIRSR
jgi:hypothetical protein